MAEYTLRILLNVCSPFFNMIQEKFKETASLNASSTSSDVTTEKPMLFFKSPLYVIHQQELKKYHPSNSVNFRTGKCYRFPVKLSIFPL